MSKQPLTPERIRVLKLRIAGIRKAEMAIRYGARYVTFQGEPMFGDRFAIERRKHLCKVIHSRGYEPFAESLMRLKIARSKYAAELEGLPWQ